MRNLNLAWRMMSKSNGSLILKEQAELGAAPFLFSEDDLPRIDKEKPKFHCTGERLFRDRPEVYKAVVKLLAEPGVSVRTICRECHVSDHTIRSVASREGIAIATVKKEVLSNIAHGMRLASERVIELMPEANARDALLGVGILGDKMALLGGEPTARLEINEHFDMARGIAELNEMLNKAEKLYRLKLANAQVVDDPASVTGLAREDSEQKALMNGDHEQSHRAQDNARTAVIDVDAALVADESENDAGEAI
jgi:transposase-like protein